MSKLTKAQRELLFDLPGGCVPEYKPGKRLIELGLAVRPHPDSNFLDITKAGIAARAALAQESQP